MDVETTQDPLRAQQFSLMLPQPADLERYWVARPVYVPIGAGPRRGDHVTSPSGVVGAAAPERIYEFTAFGRQWVKHQLVPTPENSEPQADRASSPRPRPAPTRSRLSVVWRTYFMPIIVAGLGGLMIGVLFLLVATAAVLVESWAYAITFGVVGLSLVFTPVSFIFIYLWRSTPDPTTDRAGSDEQT